MKTYNRALDYLALAADNYAKGRVKTAAKFFDDAVKAPDLQAAISIIEASNAQAYTARVQATAKKEVKAKAQITAAEAKALAALGADPDEIACEEVEAEAEPEGEPEAVEDEAVEDEDREDFSFANALASLKKPAPKKK